MTAILDQVARSSLHLRHGRVRPRTTDEFFCLRLAAKLGDSSAAQHYLELAEHFSRNQLLVAYRRAVASRVHHDLPRRFHVELEPLRHRDGDNGNGREISSLLSIRIDRRAVAVALFTGDHLDYTQPRQLSSSPQKAVASTVTFISRNVERCEIESAALESIPNGDQRQRLLLQQAAVRVLTEQSVSIVEVSKGDLFDASGYPPLHARKEIRQIASQIWPALDGEPGSPWTHDAAMLGLYVQTERLLDVIN